MTARRLRRAQGSKLSKHPGSGRSYAADAIKATSHPTRALILKALRDEDRSTVELEELTGKEARTVVLGHLQRGGTPNAYDRVLATRFGERAVDLIARKQFGKMVASHPPDIVPISLSEVVGKTKSVPVDHDLVETARAIGMSFGD